MREDVGVWVRGAGGARPKAERWVGAGGVAPSGHGGPGVNPRKKLKLQMHVGEFLEHFKSKMRISMRPECTSFMS